MESRPFGRTQREVPIVGQGTWYSPQDRREDAVRALQIGLDLGMTHLDTAEMYLSGRAEEWVAEAIDGQRDQVFLVSKVLPDHASRRGTIAACEASLRRLQTDHLDCYLLHWRGRYPLAETVEAFHQLQRAGKILSWGVSNFDVDDLDEVAALDVPACNQVLYYPQERAIEHAVLPWCTAHASALVAYSSYGHGDFPAPHTRGGRALAAVAEELGATPRQVALRFLLRWPGSFVIPKSCHPAHLAENAAAADLTLSAEQIARLEQAFPRGARPAYLPML